MTKSSSIYFSFKALIILSIFSIISCEKRSSYELAEQVLMDNNISLEKYKIILIIPNAGCTGCIQSATLFAKKNHSDPSMLVTFTNINDPKLLKIILGSNIVNKDNVILDINNTYSKLIKTNIYPLQFDIDNGHIINMKYWKE